MDYEEYTSESKNTKRGKNIKKSDDTEAFLTTSAENHPNSVKIVHFLDLHWNREGFIIVNSLALSQVEC